MERRDTTGAKLSSKNVLENIGVRYEVWGYYCESVEVEGQGRERDQKTEEARYRVRHPSTEGNRHYKTESAGQKGRSAAGRGDTSPMQSALKQNQSRWRERSCQHLGMELGIQVMHAPSETQDTLKAEIPRIHEMLKHPETFAYPALVVGKMADYPVFHEVLKPGALYIVNLLKDIDYWILRRKALPMGTTQHLASQCPSADIFAQGVGLFRIIIEHGVPCIVEMFKKKEPYAAHTFMQLVWSTRFHHPMTPGIPYIVDLLKNAKADLETSGLDAFGELADHPVFHEAMKAGITHVVRALSASTGDVRDSAAVVFRKLLDHCVFRIIIEHEVPYIMEMLKKKEPYAVHTFMQLARYIRFHRAMKPGIPYIVDLLKYGVDMDQITAIRAFANMATYPIFHEALNRGIPHLQRMLNENDRYQRDAAHALGKLTRNHKTKQDMPSLRSGRGADITLCITLRVRLSVRSLFKFCQLRTQIDLRRRASESALYSDGEFQQELRRWLIFRFSAEWCCPWQDPSIILVATPRPPAASRLYIEEAKEPDETGTVAHSDHGNAAPDSDKDGDIGAGLGNQRMPAEAVVVQESSDTEGFRVVHRLRVPVAERPSQLRVAAPKDGVAPNILRRTRTPAERQGEGIRRTLQYDEGQSVMNAGSYKGADVPSLRMYNG
ncbi:hypothetical protein C8R45DRAFT_934071 [Mycena sanguinolenta]|nr:hypothetical protein C8R45DRAFT_934071 [Mycena sanguinolenta]